MDRGGFNAEPLTVANRTEFQQPLTFPWRWVKTSASSQGYISLGLHIDIVSPADHLDDFRTVPLLCAGDFLKKTALPLLFPLFLYLMCLHCQPGDHEETDKG